MSTNCKINSKKISRYGFFIALNIVVNSKKKPTSWWVFLVVCFIKNLLNEFCGCFFIANAKLYNISAFR